MELSGREINKYINVKKSMKYNFLCVLFLLRACSSIEKNDYWRRVIVRPLDGSKTITIFTLENRRYIMDGYYEEIPDNNYILLDMSMVDGLGDVIAVCWNKEKKGWKIQSTYATLLEHKLDKDKFIFYNPKGKYGGPVEGDYGDKNCGSVLIREKLNTRGDLILKYLESKDVLYPISNNEAE